MKLSLIIPVYNGGQFVANLGDNILKLHQAVEGIEFIVVNDGSTDNTSEQLHAFFDAHRHLNLAYQLINRENGGVSSARNEALKHAGGEYVMFMDHDDNIDAEKLVVLLEKMQHTPVDLLQFNCGARYSADDRVLNLEQYMVDFPFVSYVWAYIYKRSIIRQHGMKFTVGMKYLEDGLFVLDYLLKADKVMVSNSRVYDYVENPASAMRAKRTPAQSQKFLDDIGLAVREYSRMVGISKLPAVDTRVKEIRDSFLFIYIMNMLKLNISREELFGRLQACGYDFKLANYPSKFNNRAQVRVLCSLFRSKVSLGLLARTNVLNLIKSAA